MKMVQALPFSTSGLLSRKRSSTRMKYTVPIAYDSLSVQYESRADSIPARALFHL